MPWKETCAVDEREQFVLAILRGEESVSELCRFYGISRKTGYKWLTRYEEEGKNGLGNRSHAPRDCPHRLNDVTIARLLALRALHPSWGPKKIRGWLDDREPGGCWPALSTIGELLHARGLTVGRKRKLRVPRSAPFGSCTEANEVWSVDFKGWFRTGNGARCDPLTLKDAHSRYLLRCQGLERTGTEYVWPIFDAAFREFGLPLRMRSDNGPPFASTAAGGLSKLSIRLVKAGIVPERIIPGKPQQNGRHERFHLTLKKETASPPAANLRAQQNRFDRFQRLYNEERPHEALKQTPPARHYAASPRRYSGRLHEPEYATDVEVRRVRRTGEIKWRNGFLYISQNLAGEPVGLQERDEDVWQVHYGPIELGIIDAQGRFRVPRHRRPPS